MHLSAQLCRLWQLENAMLSSCTGPQSQGSAWKTKALNIYWTEYHWIFCELWTNCILNSFVTMVIQTIDFIFFYFYVLLFCLSKSTVHAVPEEVRRERWPHQTWIIEERKLTHGYWKSNQSPLKKLQVFQPLKPSWSFPKFLMSLNIVFPLI